MKIRTETKKKKKSLAVGIILALCIISISILGYSMKKDAVAVKGVIHIKDGKQYVTIDPFSTCSGDYNISEEVAQKYSDGEQVECNIITLPTPFEAMHYYKVVIK